MIESCAVQGVFSVITPASSKSKGAAQIAQLFFFCQMKVFNQFNDFSTFS